MDSFVQGAKRWILAGREMETVEAYTLFRVLTDDGLNVPYLVTEFIKGDPRSGNSLRGWINDSRLNLQLRLYFAHTICSGMIKLQKKLGRPGADFVHLNLKPQNILVTHEGTLKITDIGLTEIAYKKAIQGRLISRPFKNQDDPQGFATAKGILGTPPSLTPSRNPVLGVRVFCLYGKSESQIRHAHEKKKRRPVFLAKNMRHEIRH